jgi:hypothetical protein
MSRRLRAPLAFLLALVVGVSFDFRSILHAHEDWQQNLRAHELARIDRTKGCDAAPHFDRAHSEIEPACAACLAAATALDRAAANATVAPAAELATTARAGAPIPHASAPVVSHDGRAPPRQLSPA